MRGKLRMQQDILYAKQDGIATATFNRPDSLNAFRAATFQELFRILEDVRSDDDVRVLIITGNGRAFSAGIDLKELASLCGNSTSSGELQEELKLLKELTRRMVGLPKVIVAAVNGIARGVGVELAIACDIRIASEDATFAFPEVKHGLFVTNGVLYFLPRLVGLARTSEWLLTGETITAEDALNAGLVTRVAPKDRLMEFALNLAAICKSNAPVSVRLTKQGLQKSFQSDLNGMMEFEEASLLECHKSGDLLEGVSAYLEKRLPNYKGK